MAFQGMLQPQRQPGLGERLARSSTNLTPALFQSLNQMASGKAENEAVKRLIGQDVSGLSPELKQEFVKNILKAQGGKQAEKQEAIGTALETIQEMRGLIPSAGPSNYLQGLLPGETAKNRAKLAQLGTSLIPLVAAGVPIRNQREFEQYRKIITDPNARQSQIEGALEGLESIFQRSLDKPPEMESEIQEELQLRHQEKSQKVKVQTPQGKVVFVPKDQVKAAMAAGGKVVK